MNKEFTQTEGEQKLLRNVMANNASTQQKKMAVDAQKVINDLQNTESSD